MQNALNSDVKFLLKTPKSPEPTLISLVYRFGNQRFVYSTGQFIEPFQWDSVNQRAFTTQKQRHIRQQHENINAHLDRHRAALIQTMSALQLAKVPVDNPTLKLHLDNYLDKDRPRPLEKVAAPVASFVDWIADFVAGAKAGRKLNARGGRFSDGTLINYNKFRNKLLEYQTETGQRLTNDSFTLDFYDSFKSYLVRKGNSLNYVGAILNGVKMLLKQAYSAGLPVGEDCKSREFRKLEEEVDSVYLTNTDLDKLFALDLTKGPRLDRVRDIFLIGCYTGLRFTNYNELRPENFNPENNQLTVRAIKNGPRVVIPLNPNVQTVVAKYDGTLPKPLTNQKFNQYLKELAKLAGLMQPVERTRTEGGKRATQTAQKWEMITTHTARRSFATNAVLAGIEPYRVMKITGHKTESQFWKYVKVSPEENALLLLNHPHFGGSGSDNALTTVVRPLHQKAA